MWELGLLDLKWRRRRFAIAILSTAVVLSLTLHASSWTLSRLAGRSSAPDRVAITPSPTRSFFDGFACG
jgi:hypothetical protein